MFGSCDYYYSPTLTIALNAQQQPRSDKQYRHRCSGSIEKTAGADNALRTSRNAVSCYRVTTQQSLDLARNAKGIV